MGKANNNKSRASKSKKKASASKSGKHGREARTEATAFTNGAELPPEEKVSFALATLLENDVPEDASLADYQMMLNVVVKGWNLSLLEPEEIVDVIKKYAELNADADADEVEGGCRLLLYWVAKKKELFPDDRRYITVAKVYDDGYTFIIHALALMDAPELENE